MDSNLEKNLSGTFKVFFNGTNTSSSGLEKTANDGIYSLADSVAKAVLVSAHFATLLYAGLFTFATYTKVEICHPVFAILFQECILLCAFEVVTFILLLSTGVDIDNYKTMKATPPQIAAVHCHQWSWLFVTCLRFV